jgi:hypothetical protein
MSNILDKFSKITINEHDKKETEYLDLQMTKEDYEFCKSIEDQYNIAYSLLQKHNNEIVELVKHHATKDELDKWNEREYYFPTFARLCDYTIKQNDLKYCNNSFISMIQSYFSIKYKKEMNLMPNLELINKKCDERITIKDVMNYLMEKYNWKPTQK